MKHRKALGPLGFILAILGIGALLGGLAGYFGAQYFGTTEWQGLIIQNNPSADITLILVLAFGGMFLLWLLLGRKR